MHAGAECFLNYKSRPDSWYGMKFFPRRTDADKEVFSFRKNQLPQEIIEDLDSAESDRVARALSKMLNKWIDERMKKLRFTEAEIASFRRTVEAGRDKGNEYLERWIKDRDKTFPVSSALRMEKKCAVCEGANGSLFPKRK